MQNCIKFLLILTLLIHNAEENYWWKTRPKMTCNAFFSSLVHLCSNHFEDLFCFCNRQRLSMFSYTYIVYLTGN